MKTCENCHGKKIQSYKRAHPMQPGDRFSPVTYHTMDCPRCKGSGIEPIRAYCDCNGNETPVSASVNTEHCAAMIDGLNVEYDAMIARCTKCGNPTNYGGSDESIELMDAETRAGHEAYSKVKEEQTHE